MDADAQLQQVQDLLEQDALEQAEEVLASIDHPMTQIWLNHLRTGGQERLMLRESLSRHAQDDPDVAQLRAYVEARDYDSAETLLAKLDHPLTAIWQRHLAAGGRQRLELQESLEHHVNDPRVAEATALLAQNRTDEADEVLASVAHPITEIWRDHLRAGGRNRLGLAASDTAPDQNDTEDEPALDARMRRVRELMLQAERQQYGSEPALGGYKAPAPAKGVGDAAWLSVAVQPETPQTAAAPVLNAVPQVAMASGHKTAIVDWVLALVRRNFGEHPVGAIGATLGFFIVLRIALTGTAVGAVVGVLLSVALFTIVLGAVKTHVHAESDTLTRTFSLNRFALGSTTADFTKRITCQLEAPPALHIPPSISALNLGPEPAVEGSDTNIQAQIIVRTVFFALWAWGRIELREIVVNHRFFKQTFAGVSKVMVLPVAHHHEVKGAVENQMLDALKQWQRNVNRQHRLLQPWVAGPEIETLFDMVLQRPAAIVQAAQQDGIKAGYLSRGMFRGTGFTPEVLETVNAEAHNLNLLMGRIAVQQPTMHHRIIVAAAQASQTLPAFGLKRNTTAV